MPSQSCIPGYDEALASERKDRAFVFIGLKEKICGLDCEYLTPRRLEWLRAFDNPFAVGGDSVPNTAILQFLWVVNPNFTTDKEKRNQFIEGCAGLKIADAPKEIDEYLDRAFLDAPTGKPAVPYVSVAASLVYSMSRDPFHWTMERTLDTPIQIIYQLLKADDYHNGRTVHNARSSKIEADWQRGLNVVQHKTGRGLEKAVDKRRKEGWMTVSNPMPTLKNGKQVGWEIVMARRQQRG